MLLGGLPEPCGWSQGPLLGKAGSDLVSLGLLVCLLGTGWGCFLKTPDSCTPCPGDVRFGRQLPVRSF